MRLFRQLESAYAVPSFSFPGAFTLGSTCLLVEGNSEMKSGLAERFPGTKFSTSNKNDRLCADHCWDISFTPPETLEGKTFDSILLWSVLEYTMDPTEAVAHLFRRLNPNGQILISAQGLASQKRRHISFQPAFFEDVLKYLSQRYEIRAGIRHLQQSGDEIQVSYQKI